MIVKCGNCQTRFKIPDDKVTDRGVKVRCTKCQNTFRVTKADAQQAQAPAAAAPPEPDPFGFGADPTGSENTRPFQLPPELAAMQPKVTAAGSSRLAPSFEAQADLPREVFESATRIGPAPTAPPPSNNRRSMPGAAPAAKTSPPLQGLAPSSFDPHSSPTGNTQPAAFDPFDFVGASEQPAPAPASSLGLDSPNSAAPSADPFGLQDQAAIPTSPMQRAPSQSPNPQFDFGSLQSEPTRPARGQPPQPDPFADAMTQPGARAAPAADPFAFAGEPTATGVTQPDGGGLLGDVPSATDPLANGPLPDESLGMPQPASDARAMFDMPEKKPAPPPADDAPSVPLAAIKLQRVPASEVSNPSAPTVPSVAAAADDAARRPGAARRMTAVVMNLAIAAVIFVALAATLLVYMNEGKVELASFQPARLGAMLTSTATYTAGDISNGLYDTRAGKPVFYVRGEVRNKGSKSGRVKVRAEILDGATVVQSSEVFAGAAPTPEDLYEVSSSADLAALNARLEKASADVSPGKTAPFLVTFYEFPPDLSPFRLKVSVVESATAEQAAR